MTGRFFLFRRRILLVLSIVFAWDMYAGGGICVRSYGCFFLFFIVLYWVCMMMFLSKLAGYSFFLFLSSSAYTP